MTVVGARERVDDRWLESAKETEGLDVDNVYLRFPGIKVMLQWLEAARLVQRMAQQVKLDEASREWRLKEVLILALALALALPLALTLTLTLTHNPHPRSPALPCSRACAAASPGSRSRNCSARRVETLRRETVRPLRRLLRSELRLRPRPGPRGH